MVFVCWRVKNDVTRPEASDQVQNHELESRKDRRTEVLKTYGTFLAYRYMINEDTIGESRGSRLARKGSSRTLTL